MSQYDLFENTANQDDSFRPLAYQARPKSWEQFIGQDEVVSRLKQFAKTRFPNVVLWGPPGTGKTTLAHILANELNTEFVEFNAVMSGVAELRKIIKQINENRNLYQKNSILFIDEIHRFNKGQQDALLPHLERGDFIFIGATTESPWTSLNRALISRVQLLELKKHTELQLVEILLELDQSKELENDYLNEIAYYAHGDARVAIGLLERMQDRSELHLEEFRKELAKNAREYDRSSDRHYDVISAFIKSIRGSDANSALLWMAVMIDGGEDAEFIARRLFILASEDIGNADPNAMLMASACLSAVQNIGMPEARISLGQTVIYLAQAPKCNRAYKAINAALEYVQMSPTLEVPDHLRSRPRKKGQYKYPHNYPNAQVEQNYWPEGTEKEEFLST